MDNLRFVDFTFCNTCIRKDLSEEKEPCNSCLEIGAREGTEKPLHYEKKKLEKQ